jgi:release factor glutamine methyltransferase
MTPLHTVADILRLAARSLEASSTSPELDAEVLLSIVMGVTRSALIVRAGEPVGGELLRAYQGLIDRRLSGVPVAYLTGLREFWSLPLKITPAVLVPRHETELLVEMALQLIPKAESRSVLDLGTGSGAIALAIASERPLARITGADLSAAALGVARDNARSLSLPGLTWRLGSWFDAVPGERFDAIVANPPYVAAGDPVLASLEAEPELALVSGPAGLDALTVIVESAPRHLESGGWLVLEHGSSQHDDVASMLERRGFRGVETHADFSGLPRVTLGNFQSTHSPH